MEPSIATLEAITERTAKALDELRRSVDEGFRELRCEMREQRGEFNAGLNELRNDVRSEIRDTRKESNDHFKEFRETTRWLIGIQVATLLSVIGLLAKAAELF